MDWLKNSNGGWTVLSTHAYTYADTRIKTNTATTNSQFNHLLKPFRELPSSSHRRSYWYCHCAPLIQNDTIKFERSHILCVCVCSVYSSASSKMRRVYLCVRVWVCVIVMWFRTKNHLNKFIITLQIAKLFQAFNANSMK